VNSELPKGAQRSQHLYATRDAKAIADRWDARAYSWDRELENPECHLNKDEAYTRFLLGARAEIARRQRFCSETGVVDVGCGTGLVLAEVIAAFSWGIGVDISPGMIRAAAKKSIPQARFVVGDCFQLPEFCPKAGAVVSRGVLLSHYGRDHATRLLQAVQGTLVTGGFFIFDFLNCDAEDRNAHALENKTYFSAEAVRALVLGAGFRSVTVVGGKERRVLLATAEAGSEKSPDHL
jgi:SAM-dependent methyltransferase